MLECRRNESIKSRLDIPRGQISLIDLGPSGGEEEEAELMKRRSEEEEEE